jgi:hypothetical protein
VSNNIKQNLKKKKKVVKKLSKKCQKVYTKLSKIDKKWSKNGQKNGQKNVKKLSKLSKSLIFWGTACRGKIWQHRCQKGSKSCQKVVKSCQKVVKKFDFLGHYHCLRRKNLATSAKMCKIYEMSEPRTFCHVFTT